LDRDDAQCIGHGAGQRQLDEHVLAASMARTATSACSRVGRQTSTRSTEGSVMSASRSEQVANPNCSLIFASFSAVRPKTITSCTSGRWA
jgi:hypothetical protein